MTAGHHEPPSIGGDRTAVVFEELLSLADDARAARIADIACTDRALADLLARLVSSAARLNTPTHVLTDLASGVHALQSITPRVIASGSNSMGAGTPRGPVAGNDLRFSASKFHCPPAGWSSSISTEWRTRISR